MTDGVTPTKTENAATCSREGSPEQRYVAAIEAACEDLLRRQAERRLS